MFKGSEDMTSKGVQNWQLSITALLIIDAFSCAKTGEYKSYRRKLKSLENIFCCWQYGSIFSRFHTVVLESEERNIVKPKMKTDFFSVKWHLMVIQGQAF